MEQLPGAERVHADDPAAVHLRRAPATDFAEARSLSKSRGWFCRLQLDDGTTYLRWRDICEFLLSEDVQDIRYRPLGSATRESIHVYLLGQVLSFSLVARQIDPLHGTVVKIGQGAVALIGDCGAGKSTLAAALLSRGCSIVTDDLVALAASGRTWRVHPGPARLKLFPPVARRFGFAPGTPMNGATPKQVVALLPTQSVREAVPLKAIYVLGESARRSIASASIEPLRGSEAFLEIIRGAFNLLVDGRQRLVNQFALATRLVETVPILRITYPRRFAALPAVCDAILDDRTAAAHRANTTLATA